MPKFTDNSAAPDGRHSFLYWLVIPLVMIWFAASYLIGSFTDQPKWQFPSSVPSAAGPVAPHLAAYSPLPPSDRGYITLWFDDAWLSQYLIAYPLLQNYGFTGIVAVPSGAVEQPNYMNWAQLQILQKSGWEIADHSVSHDCQMHTWSPEQINREYRSSKLTLWKHQLTADIFVTPCGVDSPAMRDQAQKAFFGYRTVNPGANDPDNLDFYDLKVRNLDDQTTIENIQSWIDTAVSQNQWLILVFHQLGKESGSGDWEKYELQESSLTRILDHIKEVEIPVITPGQVISASIP